jgi:hydrogenase expression/formation protein HypC
MCLGIPGRVMDVYGSEGLQMGTVDFGGVKREVCMAYVSGEVDPGDYVIVHVGFAISKVDEEEARRTFKLLEELSELDELEWMKEVAEQSLSGMEPTSGAVPGEAESEGARPADDGRLS